MYNVLIVDDQTISRQLFETIVASCADLRLVDSISSAKVADAYCARYDIDLILMDVVMKDGYSGLAAAERIKGSYPKVKIIIVTSMPDMKLLQEAKRICVDSFWYKEVQELPLAEVIRRTMAGDSVFPAGSPETQLGEATSSEFTERELDVLRLLSQGLSDKEIGAQLFISMNTVRYHVGNLISKTGFSSRTELAIAAVKSGIVIL